MSEGMAEVGAALARRVDEAAQRLLELGEEAGALPWAPGKWTRKQVLGHLIDSALNNYHRVIRAQSGAELSFPDYEQGAWVDRGGYADRPWPELVALWSHLNAQLAHAVVRVDPAALGTGCRIGDSAPVTLDFVIRDYPRHMEHHLTQIFDPAAAQGRQFPPFAKEQQR